LKFNHQTQWLAVSTHAPPHDVGYYNCIHGYRQNRTQFLKDPKSGERRGGRQRGKLQGGQVMHPP